MSKNCYLYNDDDGYLVCRVQHRNSNNCDLNAKVRVTTSQTPLPNDNQSNDVQIFNRVNDYGNNQSELDEQFKQAAKLVTASVAAGWAEANGLTNSSIWGELERKIALYLRNYTDISRDSKKYAVELMQFITANYTPNSEVAERERVARLNERDELALDLYRGHTFSDSTDFRVKFNKFVKNNNRRIAALTKGNKDVRLLP